MKLEANSSSLESRLMDDKYKASWDERWVFVAAVSIIIIVVVLLLLSAVFC